MFNAGLVYLVEPGKTTDPDLLALHQAYPDKVVEHWAQVTGGRSEITTVVPAPTAAPCLSGVCTGATPETADGRARPGSWDGSSGALRTESKPVP